MNPTTHTKLLTLPALVVDDSSASRSALNRIVRKEQRWALCRS